MCDTEIQLGQIFESPERSIKDSSVQTELDIKRNKMKT